MNDNIHIERCRTLVSWSHMCSMSAGFASAWPAAAARSLPQPLGLVPRVTHPSCSGGSPESRSIPSVMASRLKSRQGSLSLLRVGRLSQGGQWPMYFRPVARLLWCAPSERKGFGSTLGQQELATQRSCGSWHRGRRGQSNAAWLQRGCCSDTSCMQQACCTHGTCRILHLIYRSSPSVI